MPTRLRYRSLLSRKARALAWSRSASCVCTLRISASRRRGQALTRVFTVLQYSLLPLGWVSRARAWKLEAAAPQLPPSVIFFCHGVSSSASTEFADPSMLSPSTLSPSPKVTSGFERVVHGFLLLIREAARDKCTIAEPSPNPALFSSPDIPFCRASRSSPSLCERVRRSAIGFRTKEARSCG
jgi:hypothetical protein